MATDSVRVVQSWTRRHCVAATGVRCMPAEWESLRAGATHIPFMCRSRATRVLALMPLTCCLHAAHVLVARRSRAAHVPPMCPSSAMLARRSCAPNMPLPRRSHAVHFSNTSRSRVALWLLATHRDGPDRTIMRLERANIKTHAQ